MHSGVILLHGHGPNVGSMIPLSRAVAKAGYQTMRLRYASRRHSLDQIVDDLAPKISAFAAATPGQVHFVTHSLGGLVARALLNRYPLTNIGRVVMLSTPNGGSEWADLLLRLRADTLVLGPVGRHLITRRRAEDEALLGHIAYPVGIIAGETPLRSVIPRLLPRPNDSTVSVESTKVTGMTDHITLPVTHAMMPYNRQVTRQVMAFIREGAFAR
ncbi:MAG: esterase/lipase family protein [Sphingomonadaceae bacterium]